jgi:hypothetical protein
MNYTNYSFRSFYYKEGNRIFIRIPFNVWETCARRGNIPAKVVIDDIPFECKLLPKGNGEYVIPINKDVLKKLDSKSEYRVEFILLNQLSRINNNSPYSKDNPIRHIDSINYIKQPDIGFCGQTCLAMLADISVDEVIKIMKSKKWQSSISKVIESLDYFGFDYEEPVHTHGKNTEFPKCCIINAKGCEKSHLMVYFDGIFYDPTVGVTNDYKYENIISYIAINA